MDFFCISLFVYGRVFERVLTSFCIYFWVVGFCIESCPNLPRTRSPLLFLVRRLPHPPLPVLVVTASNPPVSSPSSSEFFARPFPQCGVLTAEESRREGQFSNERLCVEMLRFLNSRSSTVTTPSLPTFPIAASVPFSTLAPAGPPVRPNPPSADPGFSWASSQFLRDSRPPQPRAVSPVPLPRGASGLRRGVGEGRSLVPPLGSSFGAGGSLASFGVLEGPSSSHYDSVLDSSHLGRPLSSFPQPPPYLFGADAADSRLPDFDSVSADPDFGSVFSDSDDAPLSAAGIAREARGFLLKYQGDLYGPASDAGAPDLQGGRSSACFDRGLFLDAASRSEGIALPEQFVSAVRLCDTDNLSRALPRSVKRAFAFSDDDEALFFADKTFSPDTVAFAQSLRAPGFNSSPLSSRDFVQADRAWASVSEASTVAARLAAYATALASVLSQAEYLEVEEGDRRAIAELLVLISARTFTETMRSQLRVTHNRRVAALRALKLPDSFDCSAVLRVPREGPFVFGGHFLSAVDADISMNQRAQEVARRVKPRLDFRRRPQRGGFATSYPSAGSFRRPRGRGFSRRTTSRGRGAARSASSAPAAPGAPGGTAYRK